MSQSNHSVGNVSAPVFRSDMNASLQALASNNSGASAPSTTYPNMTWYDTSTNTIKVRTEADDGWINLAYLDQTLGLFKLFDDTVVVDSSGTQKGMLGDQTTSAWTTGSSTLESLVSPVKVKAVIDANSPTVLLGTINTTSGSTVSLTGLDLTPYKHLKIYQNGVSVTGAGYILFNGYRAGFVSASTWFWWGSIEVNLATGTFGGGGDQYTAVGGASASAGRGVGGYSGLSTASTTVSFTTANDPFTAGSITVYGVR